MPSSEVLVSLAGSEAPFISGDVFAEGFDQPRNRARRPKDEYDSQGNRMFPFGAGTSHYRYEKILEVLIPGEKTGYRIAKDFEHRTGREINSGTLYPDLDYLCSEGLVVVSGIGRCPDTGWNKRFYKLTNSGVEELNRLRQEASEIDLRGLEFSCRKIENGE